MSRAKEETAVTESEVVSEETELVAIEWGMLGVYQLLSDMANE